MTALLASLSGLVPFLIYFLIGLGLILFFMKIYAFVTPYDEVALIKANNIGASIVFTSAIIGFAIPIASAAVNSINLLDFFIWGLVAGVVQVTTFVIFRKFYPKLVERIEAGETAVCINLAGISIMVGILNAACMTY